ncbi:MAG: hypothetical protein U0231_02385 [Nitrospiraceae bacterium]
MDEVDPLPMYIWLGVTDKMDAHHSHRFLDRSGPRQERLVRGRGPHRQGVPTEVETHEPNNTVEAIAFTAPTIVQRGEFLCGDVADRSGDVEDVLIETVRKPEHGQGGGPRISISDQGRHGPVDSAVPTVGMTPEAVGLPSALLSDSGTPGYVEEQHVRRSVRECGDGLLPDQRVQRLSGIELDDSSARGPGRWSVKPIRDDVGKLGIAAVVWPPMLACCSGRQVAASGARHR